MHDSVLYLENQLARVDDASSDLGSAENEIDLAVVGSVADAKIVARVFGLLTEETTNLEHYFDEI